MSKLLIFDVYVTSSMLFPNENLILYDASLKNKNSSYRKFQKWEITLYTLISYSKLNFDEALILIEYDDGLNKDSCNEIIRKLFTKVTLINKRSTNPKDYLFLKQYVESTQHEFIFYSPNNDHPFIYTDPSIFDKLLNNFSNYIDQYQFVTLIYSHFQESLEGFKKNSWLNIRQFYNSYLIKDTVDHKLMKISGGYSPGIQVVSRNLFLLWCNLASKLDPKISIKRLDDLSSYIKLPDQYSIIPKIELCRHFDSYYHTLFLKPNLGYLPLLPKYVPPLFIPFGFFNKNINIKFGYDEYYFGFTNINPSADCFIFQDFSMTNSNLVYTDIKCDIDSFPFFWKDRILKIDINNNYVPHLDKINLNNISLIDPWVHIKSRDSFILKLKNIFFIIYNYFYQIYYLRLLVRYLLKHTKFFSF